MKIKSICSIAIILFIFASCYKESDNGDTKAHFSFDYADDIKSNTLFNTEEKRKEYKQKALSDMDNLFDDFYRRFTFKPEHQIHIVLSEYVQGRKNVANTELTYNRETGEIINLEMHFPYEMFEKEYTRAHELTHSFIAPFHFPTWVDEGIAVFIENLYSQTSVHPVVDNIEEYRKDENGINAIQNWTEGQGIYSDIGLTLWCYRYSHSVINHFEINFPGTLSKVFENRINFQHSSVKFIQVLDNAVEEDAIKFFRSIGFNL